MVSTVGLGNNHRHVHFPFPPSPPLIIWLKPLCEPQLHGVGAGSLVGSCLEKWRRRRCLAAEPLQSAPQQLLPDNTGIIIGLLYTHGYFVPYYLFTSQVGRGLESPRPRNPLGGFREWDSHPHPY